jgi:hypothetical protein
MGERPASMSGLLVGALRRLSVPLSVPSTRRIRMSKMRENQLTVPLPVRKPAPKATMPGF